MAALGSVGSLEIDDLEGWTPPAPDFGISLYFLAGPADGPGEQLYYFTVCTGGWLDQQAQGGRIIDARHHLVVDRYDWARIRDYIRGRVVGITGESWAELAEKLSRLGHSEFEDYRPDVPSRSQ